MKIINTKIFQVIYYYYYLLQQKINGGVADVVALRMIPWFFGLLIYGILAFVSALIYRYWIGIVLSIFLFFYMDSILFKTVYDTGLAKKILKKKPKILNSHFLSILFVILFTVFCFAAFFVFAIFTKEIDKMGIHLIK